MDRHFLMSFVFIAYVAIRIFAYSNEFMLNAVVLSGKMNNDTQTAKEIIKQQCNANRTEFKLDFRTIRRWKKNLLSMGCFVGQPNKEILDNDSQISINRLTAMTGVKRSMIHRILHEHSYSPYKPIYTKKLQSVDKIKRKAFCEWIFDQDEFNFHRSIYYSDKAVFHLNGHVNKHDYFIWATKNPNVIIEGSNTPQRLIVWVLMGYEGMVKYEILERTVNTDMYKDIIKNNVIPFFKKRRNSNLLFQQYGAPAHFATRIKNILNDHLEKRWIGKGSHLIEWPAQSPDLTVSDYFLWRHLEEKVYSHNVTNLSKLKKVIVEEITKIPLEMIRKAIDNIVKRCAKCLEYDGGQFELFLG
uniref:Tc1-like transposase DDE domain-containing protein n=1 Tax=Strongyloides stercoralis TaxID=6248 RepID=A0AAF5DTL0_STRER